MSFSDSLTTGQIQKVLTALNIPWEDCSHTKTGWINFDPERSQEIVPYLEYSKFSINKFHGGFQDLSANGLREEIKGDIVQLVELFKYINTNEAIDWIKQVTGIKKGTPPPELNDGYKFANEWFQEEKYFVRMPTDILSSKLKPNSKLVWMEIYNRVGSNKIYSYAGIRNIAKKLECDKNTVQDALKELVSVGLIIEKERGGNRKSRYPTIADKNTINEKLKVLSGI
ncbi:helix-turn-helix domain-containing protein [Gracilimonas sp.]|uniref:helix-turn-helix domain-containing protein n=1 Tax=Gracilimonas sp. TaxID=1974203 RepID=UPI003D14AD00